MSDSGFHLDIDGEVAVLTLDRPERRNSQLPETWVALGSAAASLPETVRVVVLRGAGSAFSAGMDRGALVAIREGLRPALGEDDIVALQAGVGWPARPDLISIAAVQGHAIGAGLQLALACDVRIAAADAQFAMAEVGYGLVPDMGGTKRLAALVGYSCALDLCITGRRVDADEALRIGLVNAVVAPDQVDAAVTAYVGSIVGAGTRPVREIKALLLAAAGRTQSQQEEAERAAQLRCIAELRG
jgi:enoyl-CoA hydratase/carnithine racemase